MSQSEVFIKMVSTKKYYVESTHDICEDNYEEGEGKHVNSFDMNSIVLGSSVDEVIQEYFDKILFYNLDIKSGEKTENGFEYNVQVDVDNSEVTYQVTIEDWKKGKTKLYNDNIVVNVYEMLKRI